MIIRNLVQAIVVLVSLVLLIGCEQRPSQNQKLLDSYSRVIESGTLKVGYIAYPPSFIVDPNTKSFSGISFEVLQQAANNLGLKLEFVEEVGWGSMIEAIDSKRIDIVSTAVWPTAARGKRADFVTPIYYSVVKAYARSDDSRFDGNLQAANSSNVVIATMDGEMSSIVAQSDFPKASVNSIPQLSSVSQLLLDIQAKKSDITFLEPAVALEFIEKNQGSIREVESVEPIRIFPNSYMIGKGEYRLKTMLDTAIGELHGSGAIGSIIEKYEKFPGSFATVRLN